MKDAVRNLLICCMFNLAGGKHEKQENKQVVDNTMIARRYTKRGQGDELSTSTRAQDLLQSQGSLPLTSMPLRANDR